MNDLATCLCAQVIEDDNGELCFCGLLPGSEVAHDYLTNCDDKCGLAYVQTGIASPSNGIGVANEEVNNCGSLFGFEVEMGILRCLMAGDEDGAPPTPEALAAAASLQYKDILTMRRAVMCCQPKPYILGIYQPYGPAGGAYGGTFALTLLEE